MFLCFMSIFFHLTEAPNSEALLHFRMCCTQTRGNQIKREDRSVCSCVFYMLIKNKIGLQEKSHTGIYTCFQSLSLLLIGFLCPHSAQLQTTQEGPGLHIIQTRYSPSYLAFGKEQKDLPTQLYSSNGSEELFYEEIIYFILRIQKLASHLQFIHPAAGLLPHKIL